ncbi:MgtC/SapB family protein [Thermosulfuriphilus sp.]
MDLSFFWRDFLLVLALSFIIGLEREEDHLRKVAKEEEDVPYFGGIRTFPLIGILGLILYILDPVHLVAYVVGLVALATLLLVSYWRKMSADRPGITSETAAFITYTLGPMVVGKPIWWPVGITVATVILLHSKPALHYLTRSFPEEEVLTLSKFLLVIGVILPLLPREKLPFVEISPYQIWLSVVAVSSISYASYLIQAYVLPVRGLLLSGFLGGIYSSTATTVVIARRLKSIQAVGPIVLATGAMYLRLAVLVALFDLNLGLSLAPYFLATAALAGLTGVILDKFCHCPARSSASERPENPLELTAALLFAILFVATVAVTRWTLSRFGEYGLHYLASIIGFVDIDPFILGIIQGKYQAVGQGEIQMAIVIASISNNLAKGTYSLIFGGLRVGGPVLGALGLISGALWLLVAWF